MFKHLANLAFGAWLAGAAGSAFAADATGAATPRFPQLTLEQLHVYQKPLAEQIIKVSSVGLAGPYNPLLRSPVMAHSACSTCCTTCAGTRRCRCA